MSETDFDLGDLDQVKTDPPKTDLLIATVPSANKPSGVPVLFSVMILLAGVLLGMMVRGVLNSNRDNQEQQFEQSERSDNHAKPPKPKPEPASLSKYDRWVIIADLQNKSPEVLTLQTTLRTYAAAFKKSPPISWQEGTEAAEPYTAFAKSKSISPPFLCGEISGKKAFATTIENGIAVLERELQK